MKRTSHKTALNSFVKLMRSSEHVSIKAHGHLAEYGLTISQFGVLEALYHLGPLYQKDLAQKILKSAGNLTTVINNLEKRSLVERHQSNDDKRFFSIQLTSKGEDLIHSLFPLHAQKIATAMGNLTTSEQELLGSLLKKLSGIH